MNLKEQNVIIKHILLVSQVKTINMWQSMLKQIPTNILGFARKSLIFCLPNKSNLLRWKLIEDNLCTFCKKVETQLHVLSNCTSCLSRYTWRHDSILKTILRKISTCNINGIEIFADLSDFSYTCPSELFQGKRPDIVLIFNNRAIIIELTVCFETNTKKSRDYKQSRYEHLKQEFQRSTSTFELLYVEFTTLGFISKESYAPFKAFLAEIGVNAERTIYKCMETAVRASYYIFCRRNKSWNNPTLLDFY